MDLDLYQSEIEMEMELALENYQSNLSKISTGRANPKIFETIKIFYYEEYMPLNQLATITIPEFNQFLIKPFDITITKDIVNVINSSQHGLTAVNEGQQVRIKIPELTTERRKELVKKIAKYTEEARIGIRSVRQKFNKELKNVKEIGEDEIHRFLDKIQNLTNNFNAKIEKIAESKEKDLMTI